jgi:adenylate cyclase
LCEQPIIEKTRYREPFGGKVWEIDVFHGSNSGLAVAEVELSSESEDIELPPWVGPEVSSDPRYKNSSLAKSPYKNWGVDRA